MVLRRFAQPAHALDFVDRNSVASEAIDAKIGLGLREPLLSRPYHPVSRLLQILGGTPTLKHENAKVKLGRGIVL